MDRNSRGNLPRLVLCYFYNSTNKIAPITLITLAQRPRTAAQRLNVSNDA